jgi:uncharacterized protein (TIGR03118 family)
MISGSITARRIPRRRRTSLAFENLERRSMMAAAVGFVTTNLASDVKGVAAHTDPDLMNPWAFSQTSDGQFRIAANNAGNSPLLTAHGTEVGKAIVIPAPSDSPSGSAGTPTGLVANATSDFKISHGGTTAAATFLFSTEDGTIIGWNSKVDKTQGVIGADLSDSNAVFKGLAKGVSGGANFIYATDFHNGTVDVFDKGFNQVTLAGSFTDPNAPPPAIGTPGFAPFGIQNIGGTLFVTYALQNAAQHDDVAGTGNGFIDEFDTSGHFIKRFASGTAVGGTVSALDSPWGMTVAPNNYGPNRVFSNALLVGNFGDSHVSAFNIQTGAFLGQLSDPQGHALTLNGGVGGSDTKGLWGIGFGNGRGGTARNALFFAAGINDEQDGLFGKVTMTDGDHDSDDVPHTGPAHSSLSLTATGSGKIGAGSLSSTIGLGAASTAGSNVGQSSASFSAQAAVGTSLHMGAREQQLLDELLADLMLNLRL